MSSQTNLSLAVDVVPGVQPNNAVISLPNTLDIVICASIKPLPKCGCDNEVKIPDVKSVKFEWTSTSKSNAEDNHTSKLKVASGACGMQEYTATIGCGKAVLYINWYTPGIFLNGGSHNIAGKTITLINGTTNVLSGSPNGIYQWIVPQAGCCAAQSKGPTSQSIFISNVCPGECLKYTLLFTPNNTNNCVNANSDTACNCNSGKCGCPCPCVVPIPLSVKVCFKNAPCTPDVLPGTITLAVPGQIGTPFMTGSNIPVVKGADTTFNGIVYATNAYAGQTVHYDVSLNQMHLISSDLQLNGSGNGNFTISGLNITEPSVLVVNVSNRNNSSLIASFTAMLTPVSAMAQLASF
jgi:hypothetical protein